MNTEKQQKAAAGDFAKRWEGHGYEKGESQRFWLDLLENVYGVEKPTEFVRFEEQVQLDNTSFIDVMIPSTHVMIEQKSLGKDLRKPIQQSDGTLLTPFQQAQRYILGLPRSQHPKWIVTCNFAEFDVYDMENPNGEPQRIFLKDLEKDYYRLQFLVDEGSDHLKKEMEVSMKAGEIVGKMYDALIKQYDASDPMSLRYLNILCVRLVFCLYAEDAGIFGKHDMFHDYMAHYQTEDMRMALLRLFTELNTPLEKRSKYDKAELAAFPYTNGGLFAEDIDIPQFTDEIRNTLLQHASLDFDWSQISPTIFGGVFESTLNPETRRKGGMHYTSIENIHKVIDPLFLNSLKKEFAEIMEEPVLKLRLKKLHAFQDKLASLVFFDPACGSGNFLTESYLSLRRLENNVIKAIYAIEPLDAFTNPIKVNINQFYGIEINDFAVTVATTALWISESQMMTETERIVHHDIDFLPLKSYANIHEGNALRIQWESVVPKDKLNYIIGNPPFIGQAMRSKEQTEDLKDVFAPYNDYGKLDYVAGWFKKASDIIDGTNIEAAFVSSNSICQGESVNLLWQKLLGKGLYINFAYGTFKWTSEAKSKAGVNCVIVGFSFSEWKDKLLFNGDNYKIVSHINGYLKAAPDVYIKNRSKSINKGLAKVVQGSPPADDGRLLFSKEEKDELIAKYPKLKDVLLPFIGSREFINDLEYKRFCIWLVGKQPSDYADIPELMERFKYVQEYREKSPVDRIRKTADKPYLFTQNRQPETDYLLIPRVSSSTRRYIPIGFLPPTVIASDSVVLVYNAKLVDFGIICSNVHNAWMRVVAGRLKNDYRYAPSVYYNFPMPSPTEEQKQRIEHTAKGIIEARKLYPGKSLADMYGEDMYLYPELLNAHRENDRAVMAAYGFSTKLTESECVAKLFELYSQLTK